MADVKTLIEEIKSRSTQKVSSSQKDEVLVMKEMLNDRDFKVDVYNKDGVTGYVKPAESIREFTASVMNKGAKIPHAEAEEIVNNYEFNKTEAEAIVTVSKEFVNTYLQTGRKLPFGGRETFSASATMKHIPEKETTFPKRVGIDEAGNPIYKTELTKIPEHDSVRVQSSCPTWVK